MICRPHVIQDHAPDGSYCLIQPVSKDPVDQVTTESLMNIKTSGACCTQIMNSTSMQKDELQQSWVSSLRGDNKSISPSIGKPEDYDYFLHMHHGT